MRSCMQRFRLLDMSESELVAQLLFDDGLLFQNDSLRMLFPNASHPGASRAVLIIQAVVILATKALLAGTSTSSTDRSGRSRDRSRSRHMRRPVVKIWFAALSALHIIAGTSRQAL